MISRHAFNPQLSSLFAASPYGLSLVSLVMLAISLAIPPSVYEAYVLEPNLMWTTPFMPVFFLLCVGSFLIGVFVAERVCDIIEQSRRNRARRKSRHYEVEIVLWVLGVAVFLNMISAALIIRNSPGLLGQMLSLEGAVLKGALSRNASGAFLSAQPILQAAIVWALFRYFQYRSTWAASDAKLVRIFLGAAVFTSVFMAIIKLSRYDIMPTMIELAIVYVYCASSDWKADFVKLVVTAALLGCAAVSMFILFSYFRGSDNGALLIAGLMGYGPASFNHLCAELRENFFFFTGSGNYTFPFLTTLPLVHRFIDFSAMFGMQDLDTVLRSQFLATSYAGLNGAFIWITAFGYYYADLGNYVYLYMLGTGLFTGFCWRGFENGNTFGIVMYSQAAASIVLWFTFNLFVQATLPIYFAAATGIYLAEYLLEGSVGARVRAGPLGGADIWRGATP